MIENEIKTMQKLDHPHILKLKDMIEDGEHLCLITEWLSMDSFDYINWYFNQLTENDVRKMIKMTALAVKYCHE